MAEKILSSGDYRQIIYRCKDLKEHVDQVTTGYVNAYAMVKADPIVKSFYESGNFGKEVDKDLKNAEEAILELQTKTKQLADDLEMQAVSRESIVRAGEGQGVIFK